MPTADILPALLVRASGGVERLEATATVLGRFPRWECTIGETSLLAGDKLALYTDGVTEAGCLEGDEFGEERLLDCLGLHRDLPSHVMVSAVIDAVRGYSPHEQHDDITLIVAKCRADQSIEPNGTALRRSFVTRRVEGQFSIDPTHHNRRNKFGPRLLAPGIWLIAQC